jgi:predicted DCC family thiol-disulfide oxidoreductase YuxK
MTGKETTAKKAALIYDNACPICSQTVRWIDKHAAEDSFEMLPCRSDALEARFPSVEREACLQAIHVVLPGGTVLKGADTLPVILKRLRRYKAAAILFKLPGAMVVSRAFYRWFAGSRYWIAGFFHISHPGK